MKESIYRKRQDALNRVRALRAKNKGKYRHGVQGDPGELLDEVAAFEHGCREANEIMLGNGIGEHYEKTDIQQTKDEF